MESTNCPRLPRPQHSQGKSPPILKRLHRRGDFQHRIPHRRQPVILIRLREKLRFHHARPVGQREEFHRLAGNLVMRALFNHQPKMTGLEMIAKLRAARRVVPVIMATGLLPTEEFTRKPWLKPDATLQRPFAAAQLGLRVVKIDLMVWGEHPIAERVSSSMVTL